MIEQNHEYYVSLEVAKLLKEAGFDWKCMCYYTLINPKIHIPNNGVIAFMKKYEELFRNHNETKSLIYSAPTIDVAQRWLREVKNVSVDISSTRYSEWEYIIRRINQSNHNDNTIFALTACGFYTYEEAQELGIKNALEIILEKGE